MLQNGRHMDTAERSFQVSNRDGLQLIPVRVWLVNHGPIAVLEATILKQNVLLRNDHSMSKRTLPLN